MTLIVISVIIPVVMTILDVTTKQVRLAGNARDSEIAFHAANAGLECAQRVRRIERVRMESTDTAEPTVSCFGVSDNAELDTSITVASGGGRVRHYAYQFTWGAFPAQRCSQIDTIVVIAAADRDTTVNVSDIRRVIPSYPSGTATTKTCRQGNVCTIIGARGYNRFCPSTIDGSFGAGTIQREVLLEY